jgi:multiple sugar transport system ATP-binding protein
MTSSPAINVWPDAGAGVERGVRAEDVQVSPVAAAGFTEARVLVVEPMGNETIVTLAAGDRRVVARVPPALELAPGAAAWFAFDPARTLFFDAATGRRVHGPERGQGGPARP